MTTLNAYPKTVGQVRNRNTISRRLSTRPATHLSYRTNHGQAAPAHATQAIPATRRQSPKKVSHPSVVVQTVGTSRCTLPYLAVPPTRHPLELTDKPRAGCACPCHPSDPGHPSQAGYYGDVRAWAVDHRLPHLETRWATRRLQETPAPDRAPTNIARWFGQD